MITKNQKETINLGKKIATTFQGGDVILLEGDLGAGKTTLTKGIAEYFGVKKNITSPTFSLMNVYEVKSLKVSKVKSLVHIDTYRLENEEKLIEIGAEDYIGAPDTVCIIEWPEKLRRLLKGKKVKKIKIEHIDKGRKIKIIPT